MIVPRPRGWHFDEAHLTADGRPVVAALVDFGLYFFHNARELLAARQRAYFYLPKMESHLEARLWNDVFTHAEAALGVPHGSIRATVLIETITAAFEMDEILYELRDHAAGLNAGRWDYLFSIIKNFRDAGPSFTLPDRNAVTMDAPMMKAYSDLLVRTCHRRGAFAIGGMAAFIPSRRDAEVNERAFAKVREDKTREVRAGFDGSWVAHPDLVPLCAEVFDGVLDGRDNQLDVLRDDVAVSAADLLAVDRTPGERTEAGPARQRPDRHPVPPGLAVRQRRRRHRQPDGGRRHRRDLALPGLAVDLQRGHPRHRRGRSPASSSSGSSRRSTPRCEAASASTTTRARLFVESALERGLPRLPDPAGVPRPRCDARRTDAARHEPAGRRSASPPTQTSATSASPPSANTLASASSGEAACRRPTSSGSPAGGRTQTASNCLPDREVADRRRRGRAPRAPAAVLEVQQVRRRSAGAPRRRAGAA